MVESNTVLYVMPNRPVDQIETSLYSDGVRHPGNPCPLIPTDRLTIYDKDNKPLITIVFDDPPSIRPSQVEADEPVIIRNGEVGSISGGVITFT